MRAALYCRISLDQSGEALGVTRQEQDCRELAKQLGWEVVEPPYVDNDKSAYKHRPSYEQMLTDADAGKFDAVIAWHADRLYRRVVDLGGLVEVCKRNNVQIATVRAGHIDLTTPTGRLVAGLLAQVATYEGEAKADRWKRSVRQRREAGTFAPSGPRMFGWTREGEVIPAERDVVLAMAEHLLEGGSVNALCRDLTEQGIASTGGLDWQPQSVTKLLGNPKLAGFATLNGDIIGEGGWEPLLDRETWETVRGMLAARRRGSARPRVSLLAGMIYCGRCHAPMVTGSRMNKAKQTVRTYRCTRLPHIESCKAVSGVAAPIEEIVEAYARVRLDDPRIGQRIAALRALPPKLLVEIGDLEDRIVELEHQLDEPGTPVAAIVRAIDRAKQRLEAASRQLSESTPVKFEPGQPWPEDLARRRALVEVVVERVWLDPKRPEGPRHEFDPERVRIDER